VQVMPGDICILGSDGLFDNVSEEEMLEEVIDSPDLSVREILLYSRQCRI